jgi:hypothetical protein
VPLIRKKTSRKPWLLQKKHSQASAASGSIPSIRRGYSVV